MERLTEVRKDREKVPREQDETTHQLIRERERERDIIWAIVRAPMKY